MKQKGLVILELGFLATAPFFVSSLGFSWTTASLLDSMALLFSFAASGSFGVNLLSSAKRSRRHVDRTISRISKMSCMSPSDNHTLPRMAPRILRPCTQARSSHECPETTKFNSCRVLGHIDASSSMGSALDIIEMPLCRRLPVKMNLFHVMTVRHRPLCQAYSLCQDLGRSRVNMRA